MAEIQGGILFCDDVRAEASGKSTIIGVYGPLYLVPRGEPVEIAEIVATFNGRVRGKKTIRLRATVEVLNHRRAAGPFVHEQDFGDDRTQDEEWTLQLNMRIPLIFEEGAVIKVTVERENFKTDGSLKMGYAPNGKTEPVRKAKGAAQTAA